MEIKLSVSVAVLVAVVLGELLSVIWYSDNMPWGRHGDRYIITAIIADVGLAFLMQLVIREYWSVHKWEEAVMLGLWIALLYTCLEAPHWIHDAKSLSRFVFHALHKFAVVVVMSLALHHFKDY